MAFVTESRTHISRWILILPTIVFGLVFCSALYPKDPPKQEFEVLSPAYAKALGSVLDRTGYKCDQGEIALRAADRSRITLTCKNGKTFAIYEDTEDYLIVTEQ